MDYVQRARPRSMKGSIRIDRPVRYDDESFSFQERDKRRHIQLKASCAMGEDNVVILTHKPPKESYRYPISRNEDDRMKSFYWDSLNHFEGGRSSCGPGLSWVQNICRKHLHGAAVFFQDARDCGDCSNGPPESLSRHIGGGDYGQLKLQERITLPVSVRVTGSLSIVGSRY